MVHYICNGGCNTVKRDPGVCDSEGCTAYGEQLEECECDNEEHLKQLDRDPDAEETDSSDIL